MSRASQRRAAFSMFKLILGAVLAGAAIWGGIELYMLWRHAPQTLADPTKASPLRTVTTRTNGVLTPEWVEDTLSIPRGSTLIGLDLAALKNRLLAHGQISNAILIRQYPDTLAITIEERTPVTRILVEEHGVRRLDYLVARDGTVYPGINYDPAMINALPWLDGVPLNRLPDADAYEPVNKAGIESVSDLFMTALTAAPELGRAFTIVSLERFDADGIITVQSRQADRIYFATRGTDDFFSQLARLDYILAQTRLRSEGRPLRSVDLALGRQVPIVFQPPPPPQTHAPARRAAASTAPATPARETQTQPPTFRPSTLDNIEAAPAPAPAASRRYAPTRPASQPSQTQPQIIFHL
ncbi:FtsQ-type POTRA domain-containing protein [Opitutaceae bacterium TAV4]|nr:FtsQ-type POTRA domain-containing protein [Opitutaceae bacterium TAV4]RRK01141.1 FtsQ-type POTRA domain-containing protein [Opitutaceae bacterium TAV3]